MRSISLLPFCTISARNIVITIIVVVVAVVIFENGVSERHEGRSRTGRISFALCASVNAFLSDYDQTGQVNGMIRVRPVANNLEQLQQRHLV